MSIRIENGDYAADHRGHLVLLSETEALVQKALLCLSIPKGSFALDPGLGSELHRLKFSGGTDFREQAFAYVEQALSSLPEIRVLEVEPAFLSGGRLRLELSLKINQERIETEVSI